MERVQIIGLTGPGKKRPGFKDITFQVPKGSLCGILGVPGSGARSMTRTLAGIEQPASGEIIVFGKPLAKKKKEGKIAFLAQNPAFFSELTLGENATYFAAMAGITDRKKVEAAIQEVGLEKAVDQKTAGVDAPMRLKLSWAEALIQEPELLVIEEPFLGMDPRCRACLDQGLDKMKAAACTMIIGSACFDDRLPWDKVLMVDAGKIIAEGSPETLKAHFAVETLEAVFLKATTEPWREAEALEDSESEAGQEKDNSSFQATAAMPSEAEVSEVLAETEKAEAIPVQQDKGTGISKPEASYKNDRSLRKQQKRRYWLNSRIRLCKAGQRQLVKKRSMQKQQHVTSKKHLHRVASGNTSGKHLHKGGNR